MNSLFTAAGQWYGALHLNSAIPGGVNGYHLFAWALDIPGVIRWDQDTLIVRSRVISEASLRDLLALFHRYGIPMKQLQIFLNSRNENWFKNPTMYWHKQVFGEELNSLPSSLSSPHSTGR